MRQSICCAVVALFVFSLAPRISSGFEPNQQPQKDVGVWAEMLRSKNLRERFKALNGLGDMGEKALPVVPLLTEVLRTDKNEQVRKYAAYALGGVGSKADRAVPALIASLENDTSEVAVASAWALAQMGPKAKPAIPVLRASLKSGNVSIARLSAQALGAIGPDAKPAVPDLLRLFERSAPKTRAHVAEALWRIEKHPMALPKLIAHVTNRNLTARSAAAAALRRIGAPAKSAIPALLIALHADNRGDSLLPVRVAEALWRIDKHEKAIPALIEMLRDCSSSVRGHAAYALGWIGPEAKSAVPALRNASLDDPIYVAPYAREALPKVTAAE